MQVENDINSLKYIN